MTWLNPRDLWMYENAQGGTDTPAVTEHRSQSVIGTGRTSVTLPHNFHTSSGIAPAFNPSWNAQVWVTLISENTIEAAFTVPAPRGGTLDYSITRNGTAQAITAGETTATVTHNSNDATVVLLFSTNWPTIIGITSKAANSTVLSFSVPAPTGGGTLYWGSHAESLDADGSLEAVSGSAITHTITHSLGHAFAPTFYVPNWNTAVRSTDKGETQTTMLFSVPAPSGGGQLDWRVKSP